MNESRGIVIVGVFAVQIVVSLEIADQKRQFPLSVHRRQTTQTRHQRFEEFPLVRFEFDAFFGDDDESGALRRPDDETLHYSKYLLHNESEESRRANGPQKSLKDKIRRRR